MGTILGAQILGMNTKSKCCHASVLSLLPDYTDSVVSGRELLPALPRQTLPPGIVSPNKLSLP